MINYKSKEIYFFLLLIPFILHRYAMNLSLIYWNQIIILVILILIIYSNKKLALIFDFETKLYVLFLLTIALPLLIYQVNYTRDIIKYTSFSLVYLIVFRRYIIEKKYYSYFINIIVAYLLLSFPIYYYDVILNGEFYKDYYVPDMIMPANYPLTSKVNMDYFFPFYLYLVPETSLYLQSELNLFGFPRFYGFGYEPGIIAMVVLPLVFISIDLRKYFSFFILSIFVWIISSYAAIILWVVFMLLYVTVRFNNKLRSVLIIAFIAILSIFYQDILNFFYNIPVMQNRLVSYLEKTNYIMSYEWVASVNLIDNIYSQSTASLITNSLRYGIINTIAFIAIIIYYLRNIISKKSDNLLLIFLVTMMVTQKSPYYFSPLIFFYINYINTKPFIFSKRMRSLSINYG